MKGAVVGGGGVVKMFKDFGSRIDYVLAINLCVCNVRSEHTNYGCRERGGVLGCSVAMSEAVVYAQE